MEYRNRRDFLRAMTAGSLAALPVLSGAGGKTASAMSALSENQSISSETLSETNIKGVPMKIVVAADPFAIALKDAVVAHLQEKGHQVSDVGATVDNNEIPYFASAPVACKMIQEKKAERAILFCGTGMGMSIVANKFNGCIASVVESVFAAKMCRAINGSNILCLGAMIWGEWMAKDAVDAFLTTNLADGLEGLTDFLKMAGGKVDEIDAANRK